MNYQIWTGIILALLGGVVSVLGVAMMSSGATTPEAFTVVCDGAGKYSFVAYDGTISDREFGTFDEAHKAALQSKAFIADYPAHQKREKEKQDALKKRFKPCP